ncbi:MAG: hypothetical protein J7621_09550 [Niastella sp.]|nr:hypothetical protein [Niastella sp.]
MKKEIVDYIGCLLFGNGAGNHQGQLQLHSERQFRVGPDGRLDNTASVLTNIIVDKEAIYLHYQLPDGREVRFANAVKQVDCTMNSDYTIRSIVYETEPVKWEQAGQGGPRLLFTLQCEEDGVKFYEDHSAITGTGNKVMFEIC